jgi:type I restriction enzyme S subunit
MNRKTIVALKELTVRITKGTTPNSSIGGFTEKGINFIKSESVSYDGRINKDSFAFISPNTHEKLKRSQLQANDILFSMAGVFLGKNAIVTEDLLPANTNQALAIIRLKTEKVNPKFIHFYLRQKSVVEYINNLSGQSAQPNINMEEIGEIEIPLPPLPEQQAIAEVLSSIDDKIDLLHRNNKTLEEMAETLFRKWFVEGAKEEWEVMRLDDLSTHVKDSVNPQKSKNAFYHHFSLPAFDNGKRPEFVSAETILSNKYLIKENDILISKLNPRTPRVWLIGSTPECSICSTEFQVYRAENDNLIEFLYCFLKTQQVTDTLAGAASGTSGSHQRVSPSDISSLELMVPHEELLLKFHSITNPMFGKVRSNLETIKNLEEARNTLLPKLMSGQVRVGNN